MIREDNSGDTDPQFMKYYHEADCFHLENCKMEWKVGSFYQRRNKEQGRENRKYVIDKGYTVNRIWGEKE